MEKIQDYDIGKSERHDASSLFKNGKQITQTKPKVLLTDVLQSYHDAYKK